MSSASTSDKSEAKSFGKLALIASAAATAALVIAQTRFLQRLAETSAPPTRPRRDPEQLPESAVSEALAPLHIGAGLPEAEPVEPDEIEDTEEDKDDDGESPDEEDNADGEDNSGEDDDTPRPPGLSGGRLRFRPARPARDRLHYGLPVTGRPRPATTDVPAPSNGAVAVLTPPAPTVPAFSGEDFDAEYIALVEAITRDGLVDDEEGDEDIPETLPQEAPAPSSAASEELWWLPAPRVRYILAALAYVGVAAAVGSDPLTLALQGVRALTTVNTTADFILLGWLACGLALILPLGGVAGGALSLITRGRLAPSRLMSAESAESTSWAVRLLATSAFIAGAILYTPHALSWALDTDYPVAAVTSSSMAPALHEGELVLLEGVENASQLNVGDIIAFRHRDGITLRRIVAFQNDAIIASSDADPAQRMFVALTDVEGKPVHLAGAQIKLPFLGNLSLLGERTVEPRTSVTGLP